MTGFNIMGRQVRKIVYATDNFPYEEMEELTKAVIDTILPYHNLWLTVKVHPRENMEDVERAVWKHAGYCDRIYIVKDCDIGQMFDSADLLINKGSTIAMEGMLKGVPVIILNMGERQIAVPYVKEKGAIEARSQQELEEIMIALFQDENLRQGLIECGYRFCRNWADNLDGRSSERIVGLIKSMI